MSNNKKILAFILVFMLGVFAMIGCTTEPVPDDDLDIEQPLDDDTDIDNNNDMDVVDEDNNGIANNGDMVNNGEMKDVDATFVGWVDNNSFEANVNGETMTFRIAKEEAPEMEENQKISITYTVNENNQNVVSYIQVTE